MNQALSLPSSMQSEGQYNLNRRATTSGTVGKYTKTGIDFIASFYAVLRRWQSETAYLSNPAEVTAHPSYIALVSNARLVTPLIIEELKRGPSQLVWVLEDAYGIQPYSSDAVGNLTAMTDAWILWAERSGSTI